MVQLAWRAGGEKRMKLDDKLVRAAIEFAQKRFDPGLAGAGAAAMYTEDGQLPMW